MLDFYFLLYHIPFLIEKGYSFKSKQVKKNRFCFGPSGSFYVDVIASVLFAFNFRRKY